MIRKLAICALVALAPGFAFAADTSTKAAASTDTHVVGTDAKTDAVVKSDASKSDATVKADAAVNTKKAGRVTHKASAKAKSDVKSDSKEASPKL
jgi:hypothetical protein